MDYRAFKLVNGLAGHWPDGLFRLLATDLAGVMMALVALVFLIRGPRRREERRAGALLVLAAILAFSRVVAGTHYPGDVLAGAAIGVAVPAALFALPAARRLLERVAERAGELWDRVPPRVPAGGSSGASRP
jgi:membrane-associated phospholipid phosphatase